MTEVRLDNGTLRYFRDGAEISEAEYLEQAAVIPYRALQQRPIISYAVHSDGRIEELNHG